MVNGAAETMARPAAALINGTNSFIQDPGARLTDIGHGIKNAAEWPIKVAKAIPGAAAAAGEGAAAIPFMAGGELRELRSPGEAQQIAANADASLQRIIPGSNQESIPAQVNAWMWDQAARGANDRAEQVQAEQSLGIPGARYLPDAAMIRDAAGITLAGFPGGGLAAAAKMGIGVPTIIGATGAGEAAGSALGHMQESPENQSAPIPPGWQQGPTEVLRALRNMGTDPSMGPPIVTAGIMGGSLGVNAMRNASMNRPMAPPVNAGETPPPVGWFDRGVSAVNRGLNYTPKWLDPRTLPGTNAFDTFGKYLRTRQQAPIYQAPEGENIPMDNPNLIARGARDISGPKTTRQDVLSQMGSPEEAANYMRASAQKDEAVQREKYFSDVFEQASNALTPINKTRIYDMLEQLPRADAGPAPLPPNDPLFKGLNTPQGEAQAYRVLASRAANNFDGYLQHNPDLAQDPQMPQMRALFIHESTQRGISEHQAGIYNPQPGFTTPRARNWYNAVGPKESYLKQGLNPDVDKAQAELTASPSNYTGEEGEARQTRDQAALETVRSRRQEIQAQGEAMATGQRPPTPLQPEAPPKLQIAGKTDTGEIVTGKPGDTHGDLFGKGAVLPGWQDEAGNFLTQEQALQMIRGKTHTTDVDPEKGTVTMRPVVPGKVEQPLPPLPGPSNKLLTPGEKAILASVPNNTERIRQVREALGDWVNDPKLSSKRDAITDMLTKGKPTPEGLQGLKDAETMLEGRLKEGPETVKKLAVVQAEQQRQWTQAGLGHMYQGQTVDVVTRKLAADLDPNKTIYPASALKIKPLEERTGGTDETMPIKDPAYAVRAARTTLGAIKGFKSICDYLNTPDCPYVRDLKFKDQATIDAFKNNGWHQVPDQPQFGNLSKKWVPDVVWQDMGPTKDTGMDALPMGIKKYLNYIYRYKGVGSISAVNRNIATMMEQGFSHMGIMPYEIAKVIRYGINADSDPIYYQRMQSFDAGLTPGTRLPSAKRGMPDKALLPKALDSEGQQKLATLEALGKRLDGGFVDGSLHMADATQTLIGELAKRIGGNVVAATLTPNQAREVFGMAEDIIRRGSALLLAHEHNVDIDTAIAHSHQAYVDYTNKSPLTRGLERFTGSLGNRFIHWQMGSAADFMRLCTSNPIVGMRTLGPILGAAAWTQHMKNSWLATRTDQIEQHDKKDHDTAEAQALQEQYVLDNTEPDWRQGMAGGTLGPRAFQTEGPQEKVGVASRNLNLDWTKSYAYPGVFDALNWAHRVAQLSKFEMPTGNDNSQDMDTMDIPVTAKLFKTALDLGSAIRNPDPSESVTSPYHTRKILTDLADVAGPPQLGQAMGMSAMELNRQSPATQQAGGLITAQDAGTTFINRVIGLTGAYYQSEALNKKRAADKLEAEGTGLNRLGPPGESLQEGIEGEANKTRVLKGMAKKYFNKGGKQ